MRSTAQVKGEVEELTARLQTLNETIEKKQRDRSILTISHTALVESNIGKERLPKSLERQRELLLALDLEIETLERVKGNLETKLAQLQSEVARAELYEQEVSGYSEAEQEFVEMTDSLFKEIEQVNEAIDSFRARVEVFLKNSGNPLEVLKPLLEDPALSGLSLEGFFAGEIRQARPGENAVFIRNLVQPYRDLPKKLPLPGKLDESWRLLSDRLQLILRAAGALVPREARYAPSEERVPQVDQQSSQTIHLNPMNVVPPDPHKQREREAKQRVRAMWSAGG